MVRSAIVAVCAPAVLYEVDLRALQLRQMRQRMQLAHDHLGGLPGRGAGPGPDPGRGGEDAHVPNSIRSALSLVMAREHPLFKPVGRRCPAVAPWPDLVPAPKLNQLRRRAAKYHSRFSFGDLSVCTVTVSAGGNVHRQPSGAQRSPDRLSIADRLSVDSPGLAPTLCQCRYLPQLSKSRALVSAVSV